MKHGATFHRTMNPWKPTRHRMTWGRSRAEGDGWRVPGPCLQAFRRKRGCPTMNLCEALRTLTGYLALYFFRWAWKHGWW
jgi:hypothetical protein